MGIDWTTIIASISSASILGLITIIFLSHKLRKENEFGLLLSRQKRWQEKELEVLSHFWKKLADTQTELSRFVNPMKFNIDLDSKDDEELEIFFEYAKVTDAEKKKLIEKKNKNRGKFGNAYAEMITERAGDKAVRFIQGSMQYFNQNKIFLKPHIKEKIAIIHIKMQTIIALQMQYELNPTVGDPHKRFSEEVTPLIEEIEDIIQEMLFPEETKKN